MNISIWRRREFVEKLSIDIIEPMRISTICRVAGIALCFAALFMPAVRLPHTGGWPDFGGGENRGVYCAIGASLGRTYGIDEPRTPDGQAERLFETILMALINPLLMLYAILSFRRKQNLFCFIIAGAIAVGCFTTWIYLTKRARRLADRTLLLDSRGCPNPILRSFPFHRLVSRPLRYRSGIASRVAVSRAAGESPAMLNLPVG
jgi:hypothetical protein